MKIIISCLILLTFFGTALYPQNTTVRLKDIGKLIEARDNQLLGYGIVVGLRGTGDSRAAGLTNNALRNLLSKMGVSISGINLNARNAASVIVTTDLPSFIKKGQRVSVTVSALGDASSLIGGTLIMTPMMGPDMQIYAVAQGNIVVEGVNEISSTTKLYKNQSTVGSIPNGAIVETEIPVTFTDQHNITIVLDKPNFFTVSKAMKAIQEHGYKGAKAIDGNTIKIPLEDLTNLDLISAISDIENIEITPDASSRIVLNSKTGTIIIGEQVKLFPVAITHGGVSIKINNDSGGLFGNQEDAITISESQKPLVYLEAADTLSNLVNSLNQIGVSPKELISIIQALKESGALVAELEIL
ncbi:flagellar biosynthesis protein FlgA [bacterium]|nr:flagellar biosynthesis protein FlgA [bacterium]